MEHEAKRIQEDENLRMKNKFEKIEQSSSSSGEESADEQVQQIQQIQQQIDTDAALEEETYSMAEDSKDNIQVDIQGVVKNEPSESAENMCLEENESAKAKITMSYSEESNSPFSQGK